MGQPCKNNRVTKTCIIKTFNITALSQSIKTSHDKKITPNSIVITGTIIKDQPKSFFSGQQPNIINIQKK